VEAHLEETPSYHRRFKLVSAPALASIPCIRKPWPVTAYPPDVGIWSVERGAGRLPSAKLFCLLLIFFGFRLIENQHVSREVTIGHAKTRWMLTLTPGTLRIPCTPSTPPLTTNLSDAPALEPAFR